MSSKTEVKIPGPTPEQQALTAKQVELAEFQLEELRRQRTQQEAFAEEIRPLLEAQATEAERQAERSKALEPIQDEILQLQLEDLRRGGAATPEQEALIEETGQAAIEAGGFDIERFRTESLEALREELAPALGLRPSDTPILDRGARVGAEAVRQGGQLAQRIREGIASAKLNFPLAVSQVQQAAGLGLQQVTEATRQFQEQLRQQAFLNRLNVAGQQQGLGLALAGNPGATLASAQQPLALAQLARTTTATGGFSLDSFAKILGGVGGLAQGIRAVSSKRLKHDKRPIDEEAVLEAVLDLPVERWRYKAGLGLGEDTHVGPYAEDMRDRLGVGDGTMIPLIDAFGIGLASTKALARKVGRIEGAVLDLKRDEWREERAAA